MERVTLLTCLFLAASWAVSGSGCADSEREAGADGDSDSDSDSDSDGDSDTDTGTECVPETDASQGPNPPDSGQSVALIGTRDWSNPDNILVEDSEHAQVSAMVNNEVSNYLVSWNHGFAIPGDATITGIQVEIRRTALSGIGLVDNEVRLLDGLTFSTTNHAASGVWDDTYIYVTYGGPGELWGESWTPAMINSVDFGAALSVWYDMTAGNDWPRVDHMRITVYYDVDCG